ncbi:hypothetical protein PUNSTDRAFT_124676 [Punctularia strigosozonata HHB-11173 SS5]|uniref:uncharacterized protein n=1 Tax=Punctularia strigosozonata (strain HHB-11173) TaxID=741275 RepID=UPI000441858B|nr:uncharacterized protein PUNSTDRAFT_124676 [Punctularia strigosozonata HHB-11173 SS5]EIN11203.1 hypothetical protein PUNSTDRAFT_124676 [Punctularia strigosozonata HHB-11173 SS5]
MKLSASYVLLAGAFLAMNNVNASPIRVIMVESHEELISTKGAGLLRLGHAAAHAMPPQRIEPAVMGAVVASSSAPPIYNVNSTGSSPKGKHCAMHAKSAQAKAKAIEISNSFRKLLGMPLIQTGKEAFGKAHGGYAIYKPVAPIDVDDKIVEMKKYSADRSGEETFATRVHQALITLGPWEGRAVAFVLGCGIGVLLRMVWVMLIVTARMFKGGRSHSEDDEVEYTLVFEHALPDAEEIAVPPPQYTDSDEKGQVQLVDSKA